jgi:hypothetical protein
MPRLVQENNAGRISFTEELVDEQSDDLTLDSAVLKEVNGDEVSSSRQSPIWLNYSSVQNGDTLEVVLQVNVSGIEPENIYTFELVGSDVQNKPVSRTVDLEVREA